jgi:hypothetical protein
MDEETRQSKLKKIKKTLGELQIEHLKIARTNPVAALRIKEDIIFFKNLQKRLKGEDPRQRQKPS